MTINSISSSRFLNIIRSLIFLFTLIVKGRSYNATNVNTIRESIFKYGKYMDSYVMKDFSNYGQKMCLHACVHLCGCTGVNYNKNHLYCELLRSSIGEQLISKQGFRSSELATWTIDNSICWPNPCLTHQKCVVARQSIAMCINLPLNPLRLKNVALFKPANQSSDYSISYVASLAVDGRLDTMFHTLKTAHNYWLVNLLHVYKIHRIEIYNRLDDSQRLRDLDVVVGSELKTMELCHHYKGPATNGEHIILPCAKLMTGQYVKLKPMLQGTAEFFHLAEVEVYGYEL